MAPYYEDDLAALHHIDALELLRTIPDASVDCVVTDPPYFRAIGEPWDNAWDDRDQFTDWLKQIAEEWRRVLVPNGTLYCFASSQMAALVETRSIEPAGFAILNRIVWHKRAATIWRGSREALSVYHSGDNERIIMAAPLKDDGEAKSALRSYENALHQLRGQVFSPLREYLAAERDRRGLTDREIDDALGCNGMAGHWFGSSQWSLPSRERYEQLRRLFNSDGIDDYLRREYDDLRREYDDLRREYDDLRRPFDLGPESGARPRGEVWSFGITDQRERDRHPCQKPELLLEHIIRTSTKPGQVILDSFAGSGSTGVVARKFGRRFIGSEMSDRWCKVAATNLSAAASFAQEHLDFGGDAA